MIHRSLIFAGDFRWRVAVCLGRNDPCHEDLSPSERVAVRGGRFDTSAIQNLQLASATRRCQPLGRDPAARSIELDRHPERRRDRDVFARDCLERVRPAVRRKPSDVKHGIQL